MQIDFHTEQLIRLALAEDIGRGDCTTVYTVDPALQARAVVWVKEPSRIAGLPLVERIFHMVDPNLQFTYLARDGDDVPDRQVVGAIFGTASSILTAERTALNFLARLTGIATKTRDAAKLIAGTKARLLDTRKTTPGWRSIEKYAVVTGGGCNHRHGLDDMVLIKDNHIAMAGGVRVAIERARANAGVAQKIEVEVDTLEQLEEALAAGPDMILLDNMSTAEIVQAVAICEGRVVLEASGNMTLARLPEVAATGVDYISMGALTHAARSVDVGLDIEPWLAEQTGDAR
ncbi:nicotinate-nucleotide pyrophosphorylase [carboxylating] [Alicyclobacillus sacchari]|uniref:Probable nicotinate-nucleotide pyrophosphorylase [carboxylating] n=1 Tax=Alicyclobacillus sacchari TaxID=392010 RepID=A0A4R8LXH8_9BACL|nr:carboxylating nicotinate-nucleotide diphosphorylase [Alicyclobacillus sacchari]TDY51406.1 nicotinate-nucleotide pyrophosphorylase [carboxylating] [Alicyclobacillus sacchari]GMA56747.1 nicotinate-nucleotide pyrophosphorylase [carboxylating] [Alicyclobacillus sacchari]